MAEDIRDPDPDKGEAPSAVDSVTETVPHPADASSSPGPYEDLSPERPPVSTTQSDVPIAQSLVAGAGAPSPTAEELATAAEEPAPAPAKTKAAKAEAEPE